jgi:hypothetical protein
MNRQDPDLSDKIRVQYPKNDRTLFLFKHVQYGIIIIKGTHLSEKICDN